MRVDLQHRFRSDAQLGEQRQHNNDVQQKLCQHKLNKALMAGLPEKILQKRLEIGADDLCHPANRRKTHDVFHLDMFAFAVEANRHHCRIKANSIAELEAVGECLLRAVDMRDYAVEFMLFHA